MFYYISEYKLKITPSEILTFNIDNINGYNEFIATLTFINDYKDPIAFKVIESFYI